MKALLCSVVTACPYRLAGVRGQSIVTTGVVRQQGQLAGYLLTNLGRATVLALGRVSGNTRSADLYHGAAVAAGGRPAVDEKDSIRHRIFPLHETPRGAPRRCA